MTPPWITLAPDCNPVLRETVAKFLAMEDQARTVISSEVPVSEAVTDALSSAPRSAADAAKASFTP